MSVVDEFGAVIKEATDEDLYFIRDKAVEILTEQNKVLRVLFDELESRSNQKKKEQL